MSIGISALKTKGRQGRIMKAKEENEGLKYLKGL